MCDLLGHRRRFGVAMDNREAIPGYKVYEGPETGERPDVVVAFLDLVPSDDEAVNGTLFPFSPVELEALDARERNYRRVEVTDLVQPRPSRRVWTYVGSPAGRARLAAGLADGRAVVSRAYRDGVETGFEALGEEERRRYLASTDAPPCPVRDLRRVDL